MNGVEYWRGAADTCRTIYEALDRFPSATRERTMVFLELLANSFDGEIDRILKKQEAENE